MRINKIIIWKLIMKKKMKKNHMNYYFVKYFH